MKFVCDSPLPLRAFAVNIDATVAVGVGVAVF